MKILISISLSVFLFGCMGPDYRATDYSLGKLRHQITIGGNSMISRDEVKDAWYERARELCVDGFVVEEINEETVSVAGYAKPKLVGTIKCK